MIKEEFSLVSPATPQEFHQYYQFRWEQLRKPLHLPRGSEQDEFESQAFHCMAVTPNNCIIGVGRVHFDSEKSARIRYMATSPRFRHQGVGSAILQYLIDHAASQGATCCWLKARESVCGFYTANGFRDLGIIDSGLPVQHRHMEKKLR